MDAVRERERMYAVQEEFAVQERSPRWPRLVREHAVERWHEVEDRPERAGGSLDDPNVRGDVVGTRGEVVDTCDEDTNADTGHTDAENTREEDTNADTLHTDVEDELFLLGERCAQAYMKADALHYRAMKLLAEFDRRRGWQDTGFSSTAEWLAWRIGIKAGAARERLRTALALEQLPQTAEAMKNGELSFTKVRALTRVARPDTEATLLDFARAGSAANLERVVRGWKTLEGKSEVTAEQIRHRSRRFSAFVDDDGMVVVKGRLDPEVGALLMRAVEAASDALYRNEARPEEKQSGERWEEGPPAETEAGAGLDETQPEQRRADAVGLIAERALAAGFGDGDRDGAGNGVVSGSRAERYLVMLHVDAGTLEDEGDAGQSELEDGTRVSAETSRRLACDSGLVRIAHAPDGQVLGAGRKTRTVALSVRRALEARDRGCRFPGCGLRFTEGHHVKHWADGGETSLRNMALLCRRHHRAVHEGGVRICIDLDGQVVFFTPRGKTLLGAPPVAPRQVDGRSMELGGDTGGPRELSMEIGGDTGGPLELGDLMPQQLRPAYLAGASRWTRDGDIPWAVEARAWEALDSG
jgi:hypothetical protein